MFSFEVFAIVVSIYKEAFVLSENFISTDSSIETLLDMYHFSNTSSITSEDFVLSVDLLS